MPDISIVLPAKNASRFLEKTVRSVQSQTFNDWELIAVDDHSTDSTLNKLNRFAENDKRVHIFQNQGEGIIPALQQALQHAKGKYITRMDADDQMPPRRLEQMKKGLDESPEKTILTGFVKYFSDGTVSKGYLKYENWLNSVNQRGTQWQNVYRECVVASPNWMMRRDELNHAGGFNSLSYPEDYHLVLRWYQQGFRVRCIPQVTLLWREHPLRTSRTSEHYSQHAFFDLKIREFINHDLKTPNLVLWGTNEKGRLTADLLIRHNIPFHWMDLSTKHLPLKGRKVGHYTEIEHLEAPQLLVSVYPEKKERGLIKTYLTERELHEGKNWWWL